MLGTVFVFHWIAPHYKIELTSSIALNYKFMKQKFNTIQQNTVNKNKP